MNRTDAFSRVMVLDELEHLDSDSLSLVLAVATSTFRIIGISNTHTLTTKPTVSTLTLHFKPYTAQEMSDIISKRLDALALPEDVKFLIAPPALTFASRKVASQTGDLRACLSLVRGALEMAEKDQAKKALAHQGDGAAPFLPVSIAHVIAATKSTTTQAPGTVGVVRQLNLQARLVLLSLILAIRRVTASLSLSTANNSTPSKSPVKGKAKAKVAETLSADALFAFYSRLLGGSDAAFHAVSRSEFTDLLGLLETQGLLERGGAGATPMKGKPKKSEKGDVVKLPSTSREEEMIKGLTESEQGHMEGPAEREIRSIWNREATKIKREIEDKEMTLKKRKDAFEDATEA
jgi:cell division control protein 6